MVIFKLSSDGELYIEEEEEENYPKTETKPK